MVEGKNNQNAYSLTYVRAILSHLYTERMLYNLTKYNYMCV